LVAGAVPEGYFEKSEKLSAEIIDLYLNCNNYSTTQKRPAFVQTDHTLRALKALSDTKVGNADEFKNFILRIDQMFAKTRAKPRGAYAPDAIDEALNDPRLADLHAIRIVYADDTELPDHSPNSDNVEKRGEDRQISAFISYAHGDEALKTRFLQHLTALRREGLINVWHDRMLEPGQHLDSAIGTKLASADLVLLLLSPDFIDSNYCTEVEMQGAFARAKTGECEVATVILKPCQWKHIPIDGGRHLGDFLATPRDGKPVSEWPDHDTAFDDSVSSLRKLIQKKSPASSNTRSLSDERRVSEALRRMVGVTHIDSDNVLGWAGLQAAVLNDIHSILTQLRRAYLDAGVTRQSTSDGSTFVWKD
jgi:hypothetical protein